MSGERPAIIVKDVVKQYKMHHEKGRTLKEAFLRQHIYQKTVDAIRNVSFQVEPGSTLGIIGSNGSGKSTMLKMIARTSRPTRGTVEVNGKVSALLELGAGFHPDFTGRENVFLDGVIMGLPRSMIQERFDEIIDFAEMWEFIDAPAKTYSSGMYLRLAFSVAVNVNPDILLIDEILAVGDGAFQQKCLERIDRFKSDGKTIVFVSHNLGAVQSLCEEAIWLEKGELRLHGPTKKVVDHYQWAINQGEEARLAEEGEDPDLSRWGTRKGEITGVELLGPGDEPRHVFETFDKLKVRITYRTNETVEEPIWGIAIHRTDGTLCFGNSTTELKTTPKRFSGEGELSFELERMPFLPGDYQVSVSFHNLDKSETYDYHDRKYRFRVIKGPEVQAGVASIPHRWTDCKPAVM